MGFKREHSRTINSPGFPRSPGALALMKSPSSGRPRTFIFHFLHARKIAAPRRSKSQTARMCALDDRQICSLEYERPNSKPCHWTPGIGVPRRQHQDITHQSSPWACLPTYLSQFLGSPFPRGMHSLQWDSPHSDSPPPRRVNRRNSTKPALERGGISSCCHQ